MRSTCIGDALVSVDLERGLPQKVPRAIHRRSLAIRVLGVVAAAVVCLREAQPTFAVTEQVRRDDSALLRRATRINAPASAFAGKAGSYANLDASNARVHQLSQRALYLQDAHQLGKLVSDRQTHGILWTLLSTLLDSSTWMAASLASMVPFIQLSSGFPIDLRPFFAGFCESLVVYTVDHLRDLPKSSGSGKQDAIIANKEKLLKISCALGFLGFVASLAAAPVGRHFVVGLTFSLHLVLCVMYAKLKPRMPYLKAAYVSLCVVFMAVAAPAAYDPGLLASFSPASLARLVLVIASVAFTVENLQDLRDIKEDRETGVITIPSGLGAEFSAKLLLFSQFGCVAAQCFLSMAGVLPLRADMLLIHALCGICAMSFKETTPPYIFQVVLEPLYLSPLMMLLVRASLPVG